MTTSTGKPDSAKDRYHRYLPIIEFVANQPAFDVDAVKHTVEYERPAFIARVVKELSEEGWLICEEDGTYRWNTGRGEFSVTKWIDDRLFGTQIKASPKQDRPRERLLADGAAKLKTSELIAILVRSGRPGESAVIAGEKVAKAFDSRLADLPHAGRGELKSISPAIEKTAYCQIMAGIELGRRVTAVSNEPVATRIKGREDAIAFCQVRFARLVADGKREEFHIVTLDTKNQVIDTHQISVGTLDASLVHPREVFRPAIKDAAASVILVHNHPSGDPTPSPQDREITSRLKEAGGIVGIDVLDHIVLGRNNAASI